MASACAQSVLGFGANLDWRPTIFVPALSSEILCSLCGLFPAVSYKLPCKHRLCDACYHHSSQISSHCPLDWRAFKREEVVPSIVSKDSILVFRIRCWNAGNGCNAEGFVSVMLNHFANVCMFHTVKCQKCGEKILHRVLPVHAMCGCPATCSPGRCDKGTPASSALDAKEVLEETSRDEASLQREPASVEVRTINEMKMMAQQSATACSMTTEADQSMDTTSVPQIDSWISKTEGTVFVNQYARMTRNEAAYSVAENRPLKSVTADPAFLKSSGPTCPGTSHINPVQKATAEESHTPDCNPPLVNPHPSHLEPHPNTKVSDIQECCDVIIDNWTSFSTGAAIADVRNGRCECRMPIHGYGFLLIPVLHTLGGVNRAYFTLYAFKRFFDSPHEVPVDCVLRMRLVSRAGGEHDPGLKEHISWNKFSFPWKIMGEKTLYFYNSSKVLIPTDLEARGFVSDDKLQVRFRVTSF
ncbi:hypothetical protein MTO96_000384 [Rhipicephalus appendiculatus]